MVLYGFGVGVYASGLPKRPKPKPLSLKTLNPKPEALFLNLQAAASLQHLGLRRLRLAERFGDTQAGCIGSLWGH